jgi:hypothetical protein
VTRVRELKREASDARARGDHHAACGAHGFAADAYREAAAIYGRLLAIYSHRVMVVLVVAGVVYAFGLVCQIVAAVS